MNYEESQEKTSQRYYNNNQTTGIASSSNLRISKYDEEDKQNYKLNNSKTSINFEFEIPPNSTSTLKKKHQYEFKYAVPPMNKQRLSLRFLQFIRRRFSKLCILSTTICAIAIVVLKYLWGMDYLLQVMEKVLYILCLEFLWKSFYILFFYWIRLFEHQKKLIFVLMQIVQHYGLTITLVLTYGNQICLDKVNDSLFCFIKIDLLLDLGNLFSAVFLYLIILYKTPENLQLTTFFKLNAWEHVIYITLILLTPQSVLIYILLGSSLLTKALVILHK